VHLVSIHGIPRYFLLETSSLLPNLFYLDMQETRETNVRFEENTVFGLNGLYVSVKY
jgi:hypothetical protein